MIDQEIMVLSADTAEQSIAGNLTAELQLKIEIERLREKRSESAEIGNQINGLIKMLKNERDQAEIDNIANPDINNLFDYNDETITKMHQNIIERRRQELRIEREAKERYLDDIKRLNFLKFLKREKTQGLQINDMQFEAI